MSGSRRSLGAPGELKALNGYLQALDEWSASVSSKIKVTRITKNQGRSPKKDVKNLKKNKPKKLAQLEKKNDRKLRNTANKNSNTKMKRKSREKPNRPPSIIENKIGKKSGGKKHPRLNNNLEHFEKILTKEFLTKKHSVPPVDLTAEPVRLRTYNGSAPKEPHVITMRPKRLPQYPPQSLSNKANLKVAKKIKNLKNEITDSAIIFKDFNSNVPQPASTGPHLTEEDPISPATEDREKVKKIEDMGILRDMLKLNKIKLSNGVQITIPAVKPTYECHDCGRCFRYKHDLRKHIYIHLDIKPHQCPYCNRGFRQQGNLKTHITRMHANSLTAPQLYICHHCHKQFFVKEAIRAHVLTHETLKPYQCKHCGKRFARDTRLRSHMRGHAGSCRFYCSLCNASYTSRTRLDMHIKTHLGIRDLICHVCGKSFGRSDSIQQHLDCFHGNVKRFQCPICFKKLKGHLREHMRTHMQTKPYACIECGRRFAQSSQLTVHKRSHNGLKPYVCRVCKRPFSHSNALLLHVRVHTGERPFECAMCPQTFSQLPHMKAHMLNIHNKPEAYKCNDCGEFFKLKVTLEAHRGECAPRAAAAAAISWEHRLAQSTSEVPEDSPMSISRMRFLLAVLLRTIADEDRLKVLGFNKRLIDELLVDSLEATGHAPCRDPAVPPARRLRDNIRLLLEWTVPRDVMRRFRQQNKSTEQLLEELTS